MIGVVKLALKLADAFFEEYEWTPSTKFNGEDDGASKDWFSIASSNNGANLAAVEWDGNIWTSADSGVSWTRRGPDDGASKRWRSIASSSDGANLAAVELRGNIWTSTDSGVSWTR